MIWVAEFATTDDIEGAFGAELSVERGNDASLEIKDPSLTLPYTACDAVSVQKFCTVNEQLLSGVPEPTEHRLPAPFEVPATNESASPSESYAWNVVNVTVPVLIHSVLRSIPASVGA